MGPDTVIKKALGWLAKRGKNVSKHVRLHNSTREAAGATRPWILQKAAHSITKGGDRVTKKLVERTIESADAYVLQRNGRHCFSKVFGRQIGKEPGQTALRVIVNDAGKVITAFAITAAQAAAATTAAVLILENALVDTIEGLERITAGYDPKQVDKDEAFVETVIDFFMDLGNDPAGKHENFYLRLGHFRMLKEQQFLAQIQEVRLQTLVPEEKNRALEQFREGVAGVAAPYLDDDA